MSKKQSKHVVDALDVLAQIGMPREQLTEISAYCLLALTGVTKRISWAEAKCPLVGITPMIEFTKQEYGKEYAPNTRETFRRFSMHQFVQAGLALYNPDSPSRPVNSPNAVYQIAPDTLDLVKAYGTNAWKSGLGKYLKAHAQLSKQYAAERTLRQVPVRVAPGKSIALSPGEHSELIKAVIEAFAPRFTPGSTLVYAGDTGEKWGYFDEPLLRKLGVTVDAHGKMPDVVLYFKKKGWLILAEAVTSHGPMNPKRHRELAALFKNCKAGLVYLTAFPTRHLMTRYFQDISWETEVWVADSPSHLIHFDGIRFLGPYPQKGK